MASAVKNLSLNEDRFVALLTKLVGESERLQNNPAQGLIPREDCASDHILELLAPHDKKNGGVLEIEVSTFDLMCQVLLGFANNFPLFSPILDP